MNAGRPDSRAEGAAVKMDRATSFSPNSTKLACYFSSGDRPAKHAPLPGELQEWFPGLEILELIGSGGMGAVYKARQPRLDRFVALKILICPPDLCSDFALRLEREARVMAKMNHPHIVAIYDFGEVDRTVAGLDTIFFFVMEYVDGPDLRKLIESGEMSPAEVLAMVPQICEALQYAHDEKITHRDIKPANILVSSREQVKIADFGLAKLIRGDETLAMGLTLTGTTMGTPQYMAPEQWEAPDSVDHRADIYSLGVVIYELLTGERPAGVFDPPSKRCRVNKRIDSVVMRALEKQPDRRFQQVSEVSSAVKGALESARFRSLKLWRRFGIALIALLLAGTLGVGILTWTEKDRMFARVSGPGPVFPKGEWVEVLSSVSELESDPALREQLKHGVRFTGGWLDATASGVVPVFRVPGLAGGNVGVRLRGKVGSAPGNRRGFAISLRTGNHASYQLALSDLNTMSPLLAISHYDFLLKAGHEIQSMRTEALATGDEFQMEFYAVGEKLIARFNGRELPLVTDPRLARGDVYIQNAHFIREVEVIHFGDLPEAEVIRRVGLDEVPPPANLPTTE